METRRKKTLLNVVMVLLILVIAAGGILTVGKIKGWFDKPGDTIVSSGQIRGTVNIQRQGVSYTLDADSAVQSGDLIETTKGAQAELLWENQGMLTVNEKSEITLASCKTEESTVSLEKGEMFADLTQQKGTFDVTFAENKAKAAGAVFSVSVQTGSSSVSVYAGDIIVELSDGTEKNVKAGELLSFTEHTEGDASCQIQNLQAAALNAFQITQAMNCDSQELCFTTEELQKVLDDRAAQRQNSLNEEGENVCTITITCDTILDNMDKLAAGKDAYVPADGMILQTISVELQDGDTVFDILKRACENADIQLEYSWTPLYDSYYVEGINNLYEFDCGNESGWMYKVNGWCPNYGCSSYTVESGDDIVWCYTCIGLGEDVGGAVN